MEAENTWGLITLLESLLHFRNRKDFEKHGSNAWTAGLFSNLQLQLPRQIKKHHLYWWPTQCTVLLKEKRTSEMGQFWKIPPNN